MNRTFQNQQKNPHLAITLGDPAGIGSEIVLKALADPLVPENCSVTIVGSRSLLEKTYQHLKQTTTSEGIILADPETLSILDVPIEKATETQIKTGMGNAASGAASFAYLEKAIDLTLEGKFAGIVTAPIAKSLWKAAGYNYPGQTEVLAQRAGVEKFGMLFVARSPYTGWTLRTLLATTHIPLSEVAIALNPQLMSLKLDLLIKFLKTDFGIETPRIVIAGLNPHSGEEGQLGTEEKDWLIPWLEEERKNRPDVELVGLVPPDTMWVKPGQAWYGNEALLIKNPTPPFANRGTGLNSQNIKNPGDAYLALYHDQGLIPVKLIAFDRAINTTIGLPFIRTSPDHGTAFDIAGKGIANASSMIEAIKLAAELTKKKKITSIIE